MIKMFSFVGETVLDPFLGSGTTSLSAKNLERNSVGYEINGKFLSFIKEKLGVDGENFEFFNQPPLLTNFNQAIQRLPYIFKDPLKLDKKVDPRQFNFKSKIVQLADFIPQTAEKVYDNQNKK